jgi:alanine racemase
VPRSMPVRDAMTTDVLTFAPEDTVEVAMRTLVERGIDAAPVVDGGRVVGLLSTGDLIVAEGQVHVPTVFSLLGASIELPGERKKFEEDLRRALGGTVADVMTREPQTVGPDATLEDAATLLHTHDISRLPVVDEEGRLLGILARGRHHPGHDRPGLTAVDDAAIRPSRVEVDLDAVAANVRTLRAHVAPTPVWAVVKADGYGHGAVPVARAALAAGAAGLAVALVEEARALRAAGVDARVLLLSEPPVTAARAVVDAAVEPTVYTAEMVAALDAAAAGRPAPLPVHLKVDTGMHRVGCAPEDLVAVATAVDRAPALRLASVWTHLAVADEPDRPDTALQLARFDEAVAAVEAAGIAVPERHAANSAGTIAHPGARHDLVRAGIAVYGIAPSPALAGAVPLRPALRLVSAVAHVKVVGPGEGVSYGLRWAPEVATTVATVPIGYADGVRRRLGEQRRRAC